jgi:hypothetical protein
MEAVLRALADENRRAMLEDPTGGPANRGRTGGAAADRPPGGFAAPAGACGRRGWSRSAGRRSGGSALSAPSRSRRSINGWAGNRALVGASCWTPCTPRSPGANANEGAPDGRRPATLWIAGSPPSLRSTRTWGGARRGAGPAGRGAHGAAASGEPRKPPPGGKPRKPLPALSRRRQRHCGTSHLDASGSHRPPWAGRRLRGRL